MVIRYRTLRICTVLLASTAVSIVGSAWAAKAPSPEEIAADRADILKRMFDPDDIEYPARVRHVCFMGQEPNDVLKDRGAGEYFTPDAADTCVAALTRFGRDKQLGRQYRDLLKAVGGDMTLLSILPGSIGSAAAQGKSIVPVGNGEGVTVTPAIAFDAGFTVAYTTNGAIPAAADPSKLKAVSEACLGNGLDAGTCYSVGFLQGGLAARHQVATGG